jgi:hypothetical protein
MSFTITIGGTNRTGTIKAGSFRKRDVLNQQVDTCSFVVRKYGGLTYVPAIGDEVVVERNGSTIFGGVILRIDEDIEASQILEYAVECADYSQYLKRRLVTERYTNTTVGAIIANLVADYTSDGITTGGVVGSLPIESFSFNRLTVADCLQKLADAISYVWYVDYDKDIHFFPKNTELAPFSLSDTSGNYIYNSLNIKADLSQIRNSVLVQGGEAVSDTPRTELFSGDGTRVQFALANKYNTLPVVKVGSSTLDVGTEFLDNDLDFDVMWNFNEKYLRFTDGNTPASGTNNIEVTGTYLFPIVVKVPAPASIATFGAYEFAITDRSIRSQDEAIDRALAELRTYQHTLYEGSFRTYEDGLRSGQVLTIASTQRGKTIEVLIQSVEARMRDPEGNRLEYMVSFATLKSIGIIEYLQNQLRSKEVIVDDSDTLLSYIPSTDTAGTTDSLAAPAQSSGPYNWGSFNWGYGVWG